MVEVAPTASEGAPAAREGPSAAPLERLPRRQRVLVSGLTARSDVNGLFAEVQHYDEAVGRYAVLVLVTGEQIRVKEEHLTAVEEPNYEEEALSIPSWETGMSDNEKYEWLCDCYRMRLDDDMNYGNYWHGLYHQGATAMTILEDFLLFAKLATARGVVPRDRWDWSALCAAAGPLLWNALQQQDAMAKHGMSELQLQTGPSMSRSLRSTAERVYGTDPLAAEPDPLCEIMQEQIQSALDPRDGEEDGYNVDPSIENDPSIFADVGGIGPWRELLMSLS